MTKQELSNMIGNNQFATILFDCYDCKESGSIHVERTSATELNISGGALFKPPQNWQPETNLLAKCQVCFDKEPTFKPETEVYSRCVGYLRPVKNWNKAKKGEFALRKTFTL